MAYYNPYYDFAKANSAQEQPSLGGPYQQPMSNNPYQQPAKANKTDWSGAAVAGIGQLGSALQQSSNPNDYSVDPWAGYSGSAQGFTSGGAVGAVIGGITNQIGTFSKVNNNLNKLNTGVSVSSVDPVTGRPTYQGQNVLNAEQTINSLDRGRKSINRSLDPATHVISGIFGTRKKIKNKKGELEYNLREANQQYNNQTELYNQQQSAMSQYNSLLNNQTRLNNLYSIGTNLY